MCDHSRANAAASKGQIAHAIQCLVSHELVGPAQGVLDDAVRVEHDRVVGRSTANQPSRPERVNLSDEPERARWRDLTGYYTRFGNVKELLAVIDDRYVIMNAGDELRLRFDEQPAPQSGWQRDFVLIGDGWEKDGDYNTSYSETVVPLPSHDRPDYGAPRASLALEDDPVYRRHPDDWIEYHTRYITPRPFVKALRH